VGAAPTPENEFDAPVYVLWLGVLLVPLPYRTTPSPAAARAPKGATPRTPASSAAEARPAEDREDRHRTALQELVISAAPLEQTDHRGSEVNEFESALCGW
jgi:hypothetical protein